MVFMKKRLSLFSSVFILCLTSCSINVHHNIEEYILETDYHSDYKILQLTDIHLGDKDDLNLHFNFMDLTIKDADPDLIVVTGDLFTFASRSTAKALFNFLDSYHKKWTVVFGNHDEQCYFSIDWMTSTLNNYGPNCLFKDIQDDDIQGNSNFAINLKKDGNVFEQLIFMDSNRYYYGEYNGYDYFKQNQIDWYSYLVDYTSENNAGSPVKSLMFYHIPLPEIDEAFAHGNRIVGNKGEDTCPPQYNSGFFDVIKEKGSTTGMYFGHDHLNDFIVNYQGIDFAYGVKSTDRIYYGESLLGGRLITLHDDHSVSYLAINHTYSEVE